MKNLFKIGSIILSLVVFFCACSANKQVNVNINDESNGKFDDMLSFSDIINDVSDVDFYLEPNYSNLTEKIEEDEESSTAIKYYYDGDVLVYADYEGYGEDCFDYYTKSKSGKDLTVKFVDEDDDRYSVYATCDDYSIYFSYLDKDEDLGAKYITATAQIPVENDLPKSVSYIYDGVSVYLCDGYYYADDGYHQFMAVPVSSDNEYSSQDVLKYAKVDNVNVIEKLPSILEDERIIDSEIAIGEHTLEYIENADGTKDWYVVADVYAVFDSETNAADFANEYGLDYNVSNTDDTIFMSWFEQVALPVSDAYEDFFDFALEEVNDCYYSSVVFDEDGKLIDLNSATSVMSYY
ncbi:MAG: hypothetical protein ACI4V4_05430 [Eubacterium sp.]